MDRVRLNGRLVSTMGRAWIVSERGRNVYCMELSSKIFKEDSDVLRCTVFHEVCHLVDYQYSMKWGHGPSWKALMVKVGLPPNTYIDPADYDRVGYSLPLRCRR